MPANRNTQVTAKNNLHGKTCTADIFVFSWAHLLMI